MLLAFRARNYNFERLVENIFLRINVSSNTIVFRTVDHINKEATMSERPFCPHCNTPLTPWEPHPETCWGDTLWVCENNDCDYFKRGRAKIAEEEKVNFAYRYCLNPTTGKAVPIVSWCGGDLSLLKGKV